MPYVGINIGAASVTAVALDADQVQFHVVHHQGRPLQVVQELLREVPSGAFFGVSGRLGHISEVAATEAALEYVARGLGNSGAKRLVQLDFTPEAGHQKMPSAYPGGEFDAVASLGGEAFVIYLLTLVLGVDAGSTTTKAVLIDPNSRGIVASHYGRTGGDPLEATRRCLRALEQQVGSRQVSLVGATGSARELIGCYLAATHVYNEISAHATGAAHFDPDVDTIFEIGGQDSKYIFLRNGVPKERVDLRRGDSCPG